MDERLNRLPEKVFLWGAIGQAKLIRPLVEHFGSELAAVFDDNADVSSPWEDVPIYHGWDNFLGWLEGRDKADLGFCVGIGGPRARVRLELHRRLEKLDIPPVTMAHPSVVIAKDASIGAGSQIMAGSIIGPAASLGISCIINAKVNVDHDNKLGEGVEISPGATLCGVVTVGDRAWIGAGATVLPGVKIGEDSVVGAGAVVNKDVPANITVVGIPAKPLNKQT
ncbi:MAG: acetyltransferase [Deltaproteobacteria bacterium]|nr:acetyltransferase [Deltaproteobacteria bacterium]